MSTPQTISLRRFLRLESPQVPVSPESFPLPGVSLSSSTSPRSSLIKQPRDQVRVSARFPDCPLTTHRGDTKHFLSDCISDQRVIIGLIYTRCGGICPGTTKNMATVYDTLVDKYPMEKFRMLSLSVDPERDTPADLLEYATDNDVADRPNWDFLVGSQEATDQILLALRLAGVDPSADENRRNHSGMLIFGNDRTNRWSGIAAGTQPAHITYGFLRSTRDGTFRSMIKKVS
ncbi:MAG: SCO family protein [Akkermansiaceae bacterium]